MIKYILTSFLLFMLPCNFIYAHDTTHIHPLITAKIAELISNSDVSTKAYKDVYELLPDDNKDPDMPSTVAQRLYWGTDFDAANFPADKPRTEQEDYLLDLDGSPYAHYTNVIDGVVQEDLPATKVLNHFNQAETGNALDLNGQQPFGPYFNSATTAMKYFNQSIQWMGGYDSTDKADTLGIGVGMNAKEYAFFEFGQALHHVEDMLTPAHIHNDTENVLFAPILRYGQLINTHVVASTLRFLNCPCLALKQTGSFSGVVI
ncbi:MAG: hypothetical protein OEY89_13675 [Gammaproteobacteria bacterium]|nr:hypothetical protein [Gammaproteobacteria bacterium]